MIHIYFRSPSIHDKFYYLWLDPCGNDGNKRGFKTKAAAEDFYKKCVENCSDTIREARNEKAAWKNAFCIKFPDDSIPPDKLQLKG